MVQNAKRSCKVSFLMFFFLYEIHFGDFTVLDDRSKLVSNSRIFVTEQTALALWLYDDNWCALDEYGRTLCSVKSSINSSEDECLQNIDNGNLFEDANGFQCICVNSRKACTLMDGHELLQNEPNNLLVLDGAFLSGACASGSVWFNGNKWCACIQEPKREMHQKVFCSSNPLDDETFANNKCSMNGKQLWKDGRTTCACSPNGKTVCISISPKDTIDKMHRERKNGVKNGLRPHIISLRDITSRRFASDNGDNPRHLASDWDSHQRHFASAAGARDVSCGGRPVGAQWSDSCNTCRCTNSRMALCTAKYCGRVYGRSKVHVHR